MAGKPAGISDAAQIWTPCCTSLSGPCASSNPPSYAHRSITIAAIVWIHGSETSAQLAGEMTTISFSFKDDRDTFI